MKDWFNREKGNLQAEGGKIKISEVSHDISSSWKTLPESDKAKYDATAKKLRTEYESEFKNYLSGLTPAKKAAVEAQMGKSMKVPMASKGRKGSDGVTRKKPVTAFFEFLADMRETGGIDVSGEAGRNRVTMFSKRAGDQWKSMSEAEKQVGQVTPCDLR